MSPNRPGRLYCRKLRASASRSSIASATTRASTSSNGTNPEEDPFDGEAFDIAAHSRATTNQESTPKVAARTLERNGTWSAPDFSPTAADRFRKKCAAESAPVPVVAPPPRISKYYSFEEESLLSWGTSSGLEEATPTKQIVALPVIQEVQTTPALLDPAPDGASQLSDAPTVRVGTGSEPSPVTETWTHSRVNAWSRAVSVESSSSSSSAHDSFTSVRGSLDMENNLDIENNLGVEDDLNREEDEERTPRQAHKPLAEMYDTEPDDDKDDIGPSASQIVPLSSSPSSYSSLQTSSQVGSGSRRGSQVGSHRGTQRGSQVGGSAHGSRAGSQVSSRSHSRCGSVVSRQSTVSDYSLVVEPWGWDEEM